MSLGVLKTQLKIIKANYHQDGGFWLLERTLLDHSDLLTRVKLCVQNPAGSLDASPKSLVELRYLHVHWRSSDPPFADSCYRSQFWSRFLIVLGGESKIAGRHQDSLTLACYTLTVSRLCNSEHANWLLAKMLCSLGHVRTNTAWSRLLQHWRDRGKQSDTDYAAAWIGVILRR